MAIYRRYSVSSDVGDPVIREANRVLRLAAAVLEDDDEDRDLPFQQILRSPEEFRMPDLSKTKRLDREQEAQGLDWPRRAEDVEALGEMTVPRRHGRGR